MSIDKKCEHFTMKHKLLFIDFLPMAVVLRPRSWIPHDLGGFFLLPPPHVVMMGGYFLPSVVIMVVRCGYLLPRGAMHAGSSR
jgi:hypothetical protein